MSDLFTWRLEQENIKLKERVKELEKELKAVKENRDSIFTSYKAVNKTADLFYDMLKED